MQYFVYISSIFRKSSLEELSKLAEFRIVDELLSTLIISSKDNGLQRKVEGSIFTYCALPLKLQREIREKDYLDTILESITSMKIGKKKRLKIECVDINEKRGYSAKDIEVRTGLRLERLHYNINIKDPEILAYVILLNGKCYAGYADYEKLRRKFVNPMRHYHTKKRVSRSELKLREAFDQFGISGGGTAIDLGAAPGGWSAFLVQNGFKVIAIDRGDLNHDALSAVGIRVKRTGAKKAVDAEKLLRKSDIIHIKGGFKQARSALRVKEVDLLVDDMNIQCSDTAHAVNSYLRFLKRGASLVITVKCMTRYAPRHIAEARKELGKRLSIEGIKVLPGNRQEITVFAKPR
jgi:23S rRNA C2498 (ribose-2'-O)-methylase RlmM